MNKIKYDSDLIKLITLFESITGAKAKDCIANDKLIFVVEENQIAKAIGRNGANIKRMEHAVKKKIKIVEFSSDAAQFVRNMIYPVEVLDVQQENNAIIIRGKDAATKAMIIGRNRQNINYLTSVVRRYFEVSEIKVK